MLPDMTVMDTRIDSADSTSPGMSPHGASVRLTDDGPRTLLRELMVGGVLPASCPSRIVLDHISSRWGVLVLVALAERGQRWGELRRTVEGISEKMLASTLRTLEQDGLVHREAQPTIPPRVDYSLTPLGEDLATVLLPLVGWVARNAQHIVGE